MIRNLSDPPRLKRKGSPPQRIVVRGSLAIFGDCFKKLKRLKVLDPLNTKKKSRIQNLENIWIYNLNNPFSATLNIFVLNCNMKDIFCADFFAKICNRQLDDFLLYFQTQVITNPEVLFSCVSMEKIIHGLHLWDFRI